MTCPDKKSTDPADHVGPFAFYRSDAWLSCVTCSADYIVPRVSNETRRP